MLLSSLLTPIPTTLLTTLSLTSPSTKPLLCLFALGCTIGLGINGPFSAVQTVLSPKDIPTGNAMMTFGGGLGTAVFVSGSSALFRGRLVQELRVWAPGVDVSLLENVGLRAQITKLRLFLGFWRKNELRSDTCRLRARKSPTESGGP